MQTGLAVAATLRRIGLWAVETPNEGKILIQARELVRFVRAAERWGSPPYPHLPPIYMHAHTHSLLSFPLSFAASVLHTDRGKGRGKRER
jgi:hypothetical protein